ncbi:hypothetical protein GCM10009609_65370 [Pseudonocardia aurantiaca]
MGGVYLGDCKITAVTDPDAADALKHGVHPHAADPSAAARQWEISAALTGDDDGAEVDTSCGEALQQRGEPAVASDRARGCRYSRA